MFPEAEITKADLIRYYIEIAPHLLPHLKDRPVTLERLPDGLTSADAPPLLAEEHAKLLPVVDPPCQGEGGG